jgi:hypothetical protein
VPRHHERCHILKLPSRIVSNDYDMLICGCKIAAAAREFLFGSRYLGLAYAMTSLPLPCSAAPAEVADALAYALWYDGSRRVHHIDDVMARITAERLIRHLEQAGFVLMQAPPAPTMACSTSS